MIDKMELTSGITLNKPNNVRKQKITRKTCTHIDGAIYVADYLVQEIKTNIRSNTAQKISYWIGDGYWRRLKEWRKLSIFKQTLIPMPTVSFPNAAAIWFNAVNTGCPWDHKLLIRQKFKDVAVRRPTPEGVHTETYYHNYKKYDYFLDVWSNIHYAYAGLSVGFSKQVLLTGSDIQQFFHDLKRLSFGGDTSDDDTSMKIGFELYEKFGKKAEALTAQDVLDLLDRRAENLLPDSKLKHWCK